MAFKRSPRLIWALLTLYWGACQQLDQQDPDPIGASDLLALSLFAYYESGNCAQSFRQATELGRFSCSRAPRSQCNVYNYRDLSNSAYLSSDLRSRYNSEWGLLKDGATSACTTSLAAAASQLALQADSAANFSSINDQNRFTIMDDCQQGMNANIGKLVSAQERAFYFSARGFAAAQAMLLAQDACLDQLLYSPSERTLLQDIQSGARLLQTTCYYAGTAAGTFPTMLCTSSEKTLVNVFDFATPLP
ncbi:MAG: hypothetical protein K1X75_14590 [Leptospirales bacterium]|nr:hypothetical protein [Leptospirales bacterium]